MFIFYELIEKLDKIDIPMGLIKAIDLKKKINIFDNVKINIEKVDTLNEGDYAISGFYIEELKKIEIVLVISKKSRGYLNIEDLDTFKFHLAQTIQHEYIHHRQFIKRDELSINSFSLCLRGNSEQKYLGERDEIDAYSYDIAIEVVKYGWKKSQTLNIYRKQFDFSQPVMKRLLKKTYKNLGILHETLRRINV